LNFNIKFEVLSSYGTGDEHFSFDSLARENCFVYSM
jgi:hypothetical protein